MWTGYRQQRRPWESGVPLCWHRQSNWLQLLAALPSHRPFYPQVWLLPFQPSRPRLWSNGENGRTSLSTPVTSVATTKQKTRDLLVESYFSSLLNQQAANPRERAQLQDCSQKGSGAWLTTSPISSLGLQICNVTICFATSLWLGSHVCDPHDCTHCDRWVDETGLHDLSCHRRANRTPRHNQLNTIIEQSLTSANIPSVLELPGLYRW